MWTSIYKDYILWRHPLAPTCLFSTLDIPFESSIFLIQVLYHIAMYPFAIAAFLPRLTLISSAINITMSRKSLLVTTCYFQKSAREAAQRMASHGWDVLQQVESSDASCWCLSFNTHSWESPSDYSFKCGCQWRWFIVASTRSWKIFMYE